MLTGIGDKHVNLAKVPEHSCQSLLNLLRIRY